VKHANDAATDLRRRKLLARAAALTGIMTLNVTLAIRNVLAMADVPVRTAKRWWCTTRTRC
jgi:hypothetical protein